jgi:hypothetical protein
MPKGQSKMDNPEKLSTRRIQRKQNKPTQYELDTTIYKEPHPMLCWK